MTRKDLTGLVVVLALAFAAGAWLRWSALPGREVTGNAAVRTLLADRTAPGEAPAGADVTLVLFTDYRCPACRMSDAPMRRALSADGRVRVIYRDLPVFGPPSEIAARVALAARYQGRYGAVHAALMSGPTGANPLALAGTVADRARLEADLARHRQSIEAELARTRQDAMALGVRGTPTWLIGERLIEGALSERQFTRAFAAARSKQQKGKAPGA